VPLLLHAFCVRRAGRFPQTDIILALAHFCPLGVVLVFMPALRKHAADLPVGVSVALRTPDCYRL